MIQVRALTKSIDTGTHRVDILKGIDLEIPQGQFAAIMGPSGSGKSTLLGLLAGLDSPTSGQVILDGEDITNLGEDEMALLRGRKIGFVFQSYQLHPDPHRRRERAAADGTRRAATSAAANAPANCSTASD